MREAEATLAIIRDRGKRGLPLERVYRLLFNPDLYLRAYGRIYRNAGAMTRGAKEDTIDGMSMTRITDLIETIRYERYQWTPVRRVYIPKNNGKLRPLGIPTWTDKLLQEVMRSILEAYYEPQFSPQSHGFRPERGCHTALKEIFIVWKATKWFIEGDIKGCFDNIDHEIMLSIIREKIHDGRFVSLVEKLLKAGYLENWDYRPTLSGTPQGGIISPILANIYLDQLDRYVESTLIPEFTRGQKRKENPEYSRIISQILRAKREDASWDELQALRAKLKGIRPQVPKDPGFRRLRYIRYADDFLLGLDGPKDEAKEIRDRIRDFLQGKLKLEMSAEKTLITHASTDAAKFLGYEIGIGSPQHRKSRGQIHLRIPNQKIEGKIAKYSRNGKPVHRQELLNETDFDIISLYGSEYRGIVQYYSYAENLFWLNRLQWYMKVSLLKTLAAKHKSTVQKMAKAFQAETYHVGRRLRCYETRIEREGKEPLIARFGGIRLSMNPLLMIVDKQLDLDRIACRSELSKRLLADTCEICGSREEVEVHHIRKIGRSQGPRSEGKTALDENHGGPKT